MQEELKDIKESLNRMETKVDSFILATHTNSADIKWIKGFIKTSVSVIIAIVTGLISYIFPGKG